MTIRPHDDAGLREADGDRDDERDRDLRYAALLGLNGDVLLAADAPGLWAVREVSGKQGAIVVWLARDQGKLAEQLNVLLRLWPVGASSLVIVGETEAAQALVAEGIPKVAKSRVQAMAVQGREVTWPDLPSGPLASSLAAALKGELDRESGAQKEERARQLGEGQREFAQRMGSRKPWVTYALVAANAAMFALQLATAGFTSTVPELVRLGGLNRELVLEGELWRLVSSAFLHGGGMHLGFNMLVLFGLGSFVEKLLGATRFLILYFVSELSGALASMWLMDATVSVGASGALWGILAAHAVFAFRPGTLPEVAVPGARRAAVINLALNVMVSFRPHVDWAAHAGGAVAGAAVLWLFLLRGVPRGPERAGEAPTPLAGGAVLALACGLILAGGAVAGPVLGGALSSRAATPTYVVETLTAGLVAERPFELVRDTEEDGSVVDAAWSASFGEVTRDGVAVALTLFDVGEVPPDSVPAEVQSLRDQLSTPPEGARIGGVETLDPRPHQALLVAHYHYDGDVRLDMALLIASPWLLRVEVVYLEEEAGYAHPIAAAVARSLRRQR